MPRYSHRFRLRNNFHYHVVKNIASLVLWFPHHEERHDGYWMIIMNGLLPRLLVPFRSVLLFWHPIHPVDFGKPILSRTNNQESVSHIIQLLVDVLTFLELLSFANFYSRATLDVNPVG